MTPQELAKYYLDNVTVEGFGLVLKMVEATAMDFSCEALSVALEMEHSKREVESRVSETPIKQG